MIRLSLHGVLRCVSGALGCKIGRLYLFLPCTARLSALAAALTGDGADFDSSSYAVALQGCVRRGDILAGRAVHCGSLKRGDCLELFASNILINLYVKSKCYDDASHLFDEMPLRSTVSFVTLIQGYGQAQQFDKAVKLFSQLHREGHELNQFVFTTLLKLLVSMERAELAPSFHACIFKLGHHCNAFVGTALIDAYSLCRDVSCAKEVFDGLVCKDMVSWTGMVTCLAENECFKEAIKLFLQMMRIGYEPNNYTFAGVFKACLGLEAVELGMSLHGLTLKTCHEVNLYVGVGLLELYSKLGDMEDARKFFEELPHRDVTHWSLMISRHAQGQRSREALDLFRQMEEAGVVPNQFTLASVLQACATMESLESGKQVHCRASKLGLDSNVFVSNALMDVYAKCRRTDVSAKIFERAQTRNSISWNTLIVGCAQSGEAGKTLDLFSNMWKCQIEATEVTYSSVLHACASLAKLDPGNQLHALTIKSTYSKDLIVGNSLIDMYAKCGGIADARLVFDTMNLRDEVSWNTMIMGYSMHGLSGEALRIFEMMKEQNVQPTMLTFVGVLSACSNGGLLEQGQFYFDSMVEDYGIEPTMEHYTCMVGLLGRKGHLAQAAELIGKIPCEPSVMLWRALLGACVTHHNIELGKVSAEKVLEMDPHDEGAYVLLSNIYANTRRWDDVAAVRKKMKDKGVKKEPGMSWVEYQGSVHYFTVGETSHPDMKLINGMLEWLNMKARKEGFIPNCDVILHQVEDEEKERMLWLHSERLALAFALARMPSVGPIRIIKNLRICMDCHGAIRAISGFVQREIVVRDVNRYHHFRDGRCSCGDYW
ncbi:hypothetical protein SAY86_028103 [Trapa natans]|uniref:DYW domain-containing protein n=1 Tax=Trapa natans TaxID=22666 RepID=A0AAN7M0F9_TRANT|nr:hypothetical protein SAY86_028103 [Trapa natans]